jgi:CheY-like chemotaxis protein
MATPRTSAASRAAGRPRFLLVIDSNIKTLVYTSTLLQRFQYNIWSAESGAEALEMAGVAIPSLILVAQDLDDMTGLEFIQELKQNEAVRTIPLILLTRESDPAVERACLAAGALTCLPMPAKAEDLYRVVQVATEPMPRMNIRINTKLSVTVDDQTVECSEGECASVLSEHGVYIRTLDPRPLNTKLPVRIHLDGGGITADAVVIYSHQGGDAPRDEPGMGLQFVRISSQDQERIRRFIMDEVTRDIT